MKLLFVCFFVIFTEMIKTLIKWITIVKCVMCLSNPRASISILYQKLIKKSDKCKHTKIAIKNPDINNIDKTF